MNWTDVVLVVLTAGSLVIALVALRHARNAAEGARGAVLEAKDANAIAKSANKIAEASNGIAERAAADARDAPTQIAWDELVAAIAALQNVDAAEGDYPGQLMTELRTRASLLIDRLDSEQFGQWFIAEHSQGSHVLWEARARGAQGRREQGGSISPEAQWTINEPFIQWVLALMNNVRWFRRAGADSSTLEHLTSEARKHAEAVAKRNGWPMPTGKIAGLEPYEPSRTGHT